MLEHLLRHAKQTGCCSRYLRQHLNGRTKQRDFFWGSVFLVAQGKSRREIAEAHPLVKMPGGKVKPSVGSIRRAFGKASYCQ